MRAALILFDDDDPLVSVLGVPWPEFRIRSAMRAGAMHIVVVAGRITPQIVTAIDRARAAGVSAALARTAMEIADLFHPEEAVLLLSGPAIVDDTMMAGLMSADRPTLVCVGADVDSGWELIDARARWTGLARLDGAQVRSTAAMVGDWDLGSTLLRQAVAAKARRQMLGETDVLWRMERDEDRALAARRIIAGSSDEGGGWASRGIVKPLARLASLAVADRLAVVAPFSPLLAIAPLAASAALAWCKWPVLAAALLFLGFFLDAFGALVERATGQGPKFREWRGWILNGVAVAALAGLILPPSVDRAPLVLAVMLVVVTGLSDRLRHVRDDPAWLGDVPGYALIIGIASVFGATGLSIGLVVALTHAVIGLARLQNRLSGVLTQAR
ncbi:MAG: hypothetical protein ABI898_07105 [Sphingomonadales bacterium]